jgi:DHA1 family bicyclomycin/chloramphenicol resistance-like MFS transporter
VTDSPHDTAAARRIVASAAMIGALSAFSQQATVPSLPEIQAHFGASVAATQTVVTSAYLGLAGGYLFAGPLSDRIGRRVVMLGGLGLFLAGCAMALLAPALAVVVAGRLLLAFGIGAGAAVARAAINDHFPPDAASTAIAQTALAALVAPLVAPSIGGLLTDWGGWTAPFAFLAVLGVLAMAYTASQVRDAAGPAPPQARAHAGPHDHWTAAPLELLRDARFRAYALFAAFTLCGLSGFIGGAPYILREKLGLSASDYGLLATLPALATWIGFLLYSRAGRRLGPERLMRLGAQLTLAGGLAMVVVTAADLRNPLAWFGAAMIPAFAHALAIPGALAKVMALRPGVAGTASGIVGFTQLIIAAGWVQGIGFFAHGSAWALAIALLLAGVLSMTMLARLVALRAI